MAPRSSTVSDIDTLSRQYQLFTVLLAAKETPPPSGRRRCDARAGGRLVEAGSASEGAGESAPPSLWWGQMPVKFDRPMVKRLFDKTDTDGSGGLDRDEIKALADSLGASADAVKRSFDEIDVNRNGEWSLRSSTPGTTSSATSWRS